MKSFKRILAGFLSAVMLFSSAEQLVFAAADKDLSAGADSVSEEAEEKRILYSLDEALPDETFYLDTAYISALEGGEGKAFSIKRGGGGAASVTLTMTDLTAGYGGDYVMTCGGAVLENRTEGSVSLLDYLLENPGDVEEYNAADALLNKELLPEYGSGTGLSQEQKNGFEEAAADFLSSLGNGTVPVDDGSADALSAAREAATGLANDKTPMNGSAFALPEMGALTDVAEMDDQIGALNEALASPVVALDFAEGETEKTVVFLPLDNSESRSERRVFITLGASDADVASDYSSCTAEIIDDDTAVPAVLGFSAESYSASDGCIAVTVTRSGDPSVMCSVQLVSEDGSAVCGRDYSRVDAKLDFPFGIVSRTVRIPVRPGQAPENASFTLRLCEPSGCVHEGVSAQCFISEDLNQSAKTVSKTASRPKAALKLMSAGSTLNYGNTLDLPKLYKTGDGGAFNTTGWSMTAEDKWIYSDSSGVSFALSPEASMAYYTYNGFELTWSRYCSTITGNTGRTQFYIDGADADGKTTSQSLYNKTTEEWSGDVDRYYSTLARIDKLNFSLSKDSFGPDTKLEISAVRPILREFRVSLASYDPVKLITKDGTLLPCTQCGEYYKDLSTVRLKDASVNDDVLTTVSDDNCVITLTLPDTPDPIAYIKGVEIVSTDGSKSAVIVNNLPMGQQSYSFNFSPRFVNDMSCSNGIISYKSASGGGLYGEFKLRPILGNITAEVTVEDNKYVSVTADDDHLNDYSTAYVYNRGDYVEFDVSMNPGYAENYVCPSVFYTQGGPNSDDLGKSDVQNGKTGFYLTRRDVNVTAGVSAKNMEFTVRVATADLPKFNPDSDLFRYPCRVEGKYTYFVVADAENYRAGEMYELSVLPAQDASWDGTTLKNPAAVPVWTEPSTGRSYTQNCVWLEGRATLPEDNVITLSILSSHQLDVPLTGSVLYYDASSAALSVGNSWMPASDVLVRIDDLHYGISDKDGSFVTTPLPIVKDSKKKYVIRFRIDSGNNTCYRDITLERTVLAAINDNGELHADAVSVSPVPKDAPSVQSVLFIRNNTLQSDILLDPIKPTNVTVNLTNCGLPYAAPNGGTLCEFPSAVELLIYDNITHEQIGNPIACTSSGDANRAVWQASVGVSTADVRPESLLFVRITTDKQRAIDNEGNVFTSTVYAPVPVRAGFVAPTYEAQAEQSFSLNPDDSSLDLPVLGSFASNFSFGKFVLSIDSTTIPGVTRFYLGAKDSFSKKTEWVKASTPFDVVSAAKELTNTLSSMEAYFGGSAFIGMKEWKVKLEAGLYFDFCKVTRTVDGDPNRLVDEWEFKGAGGYFGTRSTASYCYYMLILGWPCYIGGDIDFSLGAYLGGSADIALTPEQLRNQAGALGSVNFDAVVMAELNTKLYAGVGLAKIAGVRGQFTLTVVFTANTPEKRENDAISHATGWHVTGNMKLVLDLFFTSVNIDIGEWDFLESGYFSDVRKMNQANALLSSSGNSVTLMSKARSDGNGSWTGDRRLLMSPGPGTEISEKVLLKGGYDQPEPQVVTYTDGGNAEHTLLVYLDDVTERPDDERTAIFWSVRSGDTWSEPVMLQNDGTADFSPYLCDAGDKILLIWTSRKEPVKDGKLSSLLRSIEVFSCFYDKKTGTFGDITQLTDDDYLDSVPVASCNTVDIPVYSGVQVTTEAAIGQVFLHYTKAAVPESIDSAEDLISATLPMYNCAESVYRIYDGEKWVTEYYPEEIPEGSDAATAKALAEEWKGQRFLNSAIPEFSVNNPVIADAAAGSVQYHALSNERYNALFSDAAVEKWNAASPDYIPVLKEMVNSTTNAAILAYTVDRDRDLDTADDRELFIQLYSYDNHSMSEPVRITDNFVSECAPQIISASNYCWLFWMEEGGSIRYINLSTALENNIDDEMKLRPGAKWSSEKVASAQCVDTGKAPCPVNYTAFGTPDGSLYVAWQQNADTDSEGKGQQAVYVAARSYSADDRRYVWSNGIRLNSSSEWNELPAMASLDSGSNGAWLMVSSSCDFSDGDGLTADNTRLVASTVTPKARCDIDSVSVETPAVSAAENGEIAVSLNIVNNGLASSGSFSVKSELMCGDVLIDTETTEWKTSDSAISFPDGEVAFPMFPGNERTVLQSFPIPEGTRLPDCRLKVTVTDGTSGIVSADSFDLYEPGPFYEISQVSTKQSGDGFVLRAMVRNTGAEDGDPDDVIRASFNDIYQTGAVEEIFGSIDAGALTEGLGGMRRGLKVGESAALELPLTVSDSKMNTGYVNGRLEICSKDGSSLADDGTFMLYLSSPYALKVNGGQNRIVMEEGQTLTLSGSYGGSGRFSGGRVSFRAEDNTVAMTDGNVLMALSPGTTELHMTVEPYGGSGSVTVEVVEEKPDHRSSSDSTVTVSGEDAAADPGSEVLMPFEDVPEDAYYYDAVKWAAENGITKGVDDTHFDPLGDISRAQMVTFLWRAAGSPYVDYRMSMDDVLADAYYAGAVRWALSEGITTGTGVNTFSPDAVCTRAQAVTFLARFAGVRDDAEGYTHAFSDVRPTDYFSNAVAWAYENSITNGTGEDVFSPAGNCLRGQTVTFLYRFFTR